MELQHRYYNDNNFKKHLAACSATFRRGGLGQWRCLWEAVDQLFQHLRRYFMISLYEVILTGTIMIINCVSIDNLLRSYIFPHTPPGSSGRAVPAYLYAN